MQTPEQFAARQAKERALFERAQAIGAALPLPPYIISSEDSACPWVSYKDCATLADAVAIFKAFTVIPFYQYKGTFTTLRPECLCTEKDGEVKFGPGACWLDLQQLQANGDAVDAGLTFFARIATGPVRVMVKFGAGYIGACTGLSARIVATKGDQWTRASRVYHANTNARSMTDRAIYWGTGDIGDVKTSMHHSFLLCADHDEELNGGEHSHALNQLRDIADAEGV